jgi:glycosyltransferase involved in cell wall biosynthesis
VRLLVLTDQWSPDVVGGSARVAADTARALARRNHEVTVFAPEQPGLPVSETIDGVTLHRRVRRGWVPQTFGDVVETWRLTRGEAAAFDVVLAHQATNAAGVVAQRLDVPMVFVFHASTPLEQRLLRRRLPPARRLANLALHPAFVLLERIAVRGADRILVLSEFSGGLLSLAHPAASHYTTLVSGGVDVNRFAPVPQALRHELRAELGIAAHRPLLLTVRRLEPRMGLEELIHASKLLLESGTDLTLAIAGDGILARPLRELADSLELSGHVHLLGRVPEERLPSLYAAADLFVLPTTAYEGFGISTVEALASGCPVVGTAVGATPELLLPLEPRLVADQAAPSELAATTRWALEHLDEGFRDRCTDYARRRFAWEAVIGRWESALQTAISRHSP